MPVSDEHESAKINWVQALGGALAAMSSAVLLSTVGVAGTIIGAAIGSIVATVGGAIYSHYLAISRRRVAAARTVALTKVNRARSRASGAWADRSARPGPAEQKLDDAREQLGQAENQLEEGDDEAESTTWREAMADLPWKRLALAAAGVFVAAMLIITGFELVSGRAVSTFTGGTDNRNDRTTIPGLRSSHKTTPTPAATPSSTPSSSGTTAPPETTAPPSLTPGTSTPSLTPSSSPSSEVPVPSTTPTATPTG
jgi:hypothetical protein